MRRVVPTAVLFAVLALCGCGGPMSLTLPVRGVAPLNPNEAQESNAVDVRVFPLAAADRFRAATVDQLWTDAKGALAGDLLGEPQSFTVFAGAAGDPAVERRLEVPGGTRFVGALAMYPKSDAQDRRAVVVTVAEAEKHGLTLTGFSIALDLPAAPAAPAAP